MLAPTSPEATAFRQLERALVRRRFLQLDPRMRIELLGLGLLIAGFLFWQVRVPLDGLVHSPAGLFGGAGRGPVAGLEVVLIGWLALAVIGANLAARHHAHALRSGPRGPEWLSLPCPPQRLERHLAWESSSRLVWLAVPALGVLVAAVGLLPTWWLLLLAVLFAVLLHAAGLAGCAFAYRAARRAAAGRAGLLPIERVLAVAAPRKARARVPAASWRARPAWRALAGKDLRLTLRLPRMRRSALLPIAFAVASLLAWRLPGEPALRHFAAFAFSLLAAASLAEWLVVLSGSDPFDALRVLPLGVGTVWGARAAWGVAFAVGMACAQALVARELAPHALHVFLVWSGLATVAIAILGVNYGVTLFPRADVAERLLGLSLGLAIAASVMLPLSGWIVLLAGVLHSARRLGHWSRLEAS
jgi:hypothetical protein